MKSLILAGIVIMLISGCATPHQTMVDPKTGITQNCDALGIGVIGVPVAFEMRRACVEKLKKAGMVRLEDFQANGGKVTAAAGPSYLVAESDPEGADIYVGYTMATAVNLLGMAPMRLANPKGGQLWGEECFRAVKDGYFDSEVQCFKEAVGDRMVKFKLVKK